MDDLWKIEFFKQKILDCKDDNDPDGCWNWKWCCYAFNKGGKAYARCKWRIRTLGLTFYTPYRASFHFFKGDIPENLVVDHLCYNPKCVNPDHLRVLTLSDNSRFSERFVKGMPWIRKSGTHCKQGHELTEDNTYRSPGKKARECRTCRAARGAIRKRHPRLKTQKDLTDTGTL